MWNTTDYKGNPVTWYSQDEINWLMKKLDDAYKCRDDCELHWERERKTLKNKIEKYEHAITNIKRFINQPIPINKQLYHNIMHEINSAEREER